MAGLGHLMGPQPGTERVLRAVKERYHIFLVDIGPKAAISHVCDTRSRVFYYWGLGILRLDRLPKVTGPLIMV